MKTLTMDSSTREAFILGEDVRVDASEVTPRQWGSILTKTIGAVKPQLKYFPNFEPIGEYAKLAIHESILTINNDTKVTELFEKSKIIDLKTKCMFICKVEHINSVEMLELHTGFKCFRQIPKIIRIDRVFLTIKGQFILWGAAYCPVAIPVEKESPYNSAYYSLNDSRFCLIREEDMGSYILTYSFLAEKILRKIYAEIDNYCIDTRQRVEKIESVRDDVFKTVNRVKWPEK